MTEPLPCPFCGQKPDFNKHFKDEMGYALMHRCKVMGVISTDWIGRSREELTAQWNTRAES
jgi:hypothetical protein